MLIMYAVITGASSGIGKELAYRLSEKGYDLVLVARRLDRLNKIKKDLASKGNDIKLFNLDLHNLDNCSKLMEGISSLNVELFINNAGYGQVGETSSIETSNELAMIDLNIKTLHFLTKKYLEIFSTGIIVNISSMAAFLPTPLMASYAATKAYVYSFSQAINYELKKAKKDIRVLTVAPGPVKTEFAEVANANPKMKGITVEKCVKAIIKGIEKKKKLIIPGTTLKITRLLLRFLPLKLVLHFSYKIQNRK